jgi:K+-sensing histidine kinase KdpD
MTKEFEALQHENSKLKIQNELLVGWISLLSHDTHQLFRTLTWIIEAYENKNISSEDFFQMLPQIKKDAKKNLSVAVDTGVWLKTQYGKFILKQDVLTGFDLYLQLKDHYAEKIAAKELCFEFIGDSKLSFTADKILLTFVLKRIVDNAIKYSYTQNKISFNFVKNVKETVLSISDYGTGMNESSKQSMYSFESALFEGTAGEIGSGLSLKIVQYFVNLMHGSLHIESLENKGTTVWLCLPHNI